MMNRREILENTITELFQSIEGNTVAADCPDPECADLSLFDCPIFGVGSAKDALFSEYKKPGIIGPWFLTPEEWLPGAKTVISLFFPASEEVRRSNRSAEGVSSKQWAYARVDGQEYINRFMQELKNRYEAAGVRACVPSSDSRFAKLAAGQGIEGYPEITETTFGSNWSERHAAYVCGLGTFGLSKGLITEKGMAGRFGSIIIDLEIPPDERPYTGIYDYCIQCGACVKKCPVGAIDPVSGKDHMICMQNVGKSKVIHAPRYGCGLCQTGVPCEFSIPRAAQHLPGNA